MLNEQKLNEVAEMVTVGLQDGITLSLAKSFSSTNDFSEVETVVMNAFEAAVDAVEDFDMSLDQYLLERLKDDSCDKARVQSYYESESEANDENFYWFDELDLWIWLP